MKKFIFNIILFLLYFLAFNIDVFSALKINEIYPAPPSGEYEWVELYNDENLEISIKGFYLTDLNNNKIKILNETISPYGFIIATSSSILNNDGDTVYLKNNNNQTIEIATYSAKFDSNKTFVKCPDGNGNWYILNLITKGLTNESACIFLTPTLITTLSSSLLLTPTLTAQITSILEPTVPTPVNYEKIYISEAMVNPSTGEKEWIEIYNENDFEVNLVNWFIDDIESGGSSPKNFSIIIPPKSYVVVELTSSMFNNNGDSVRLLDFEKKIKDSFEYSLSIQGKTYGRVSFESDDFCFQEPSKGLLNNSCFNLNKTPTPTTSSLIREFKISTFNIPTTSLTKLNNSSTTTKSLIKISRPKSYDDNFLKDNDLLRGEVLAMTVKDKKIKGASKNLLLLSFSYSFLAILSIILKLKKTIEL